MTVREFADLHRRYETHGLVPIIIDPHATSGQMAPGVAIARFPCVGGARTGVFAAFEQWSQRTTRQAGRHRWFVFDRRGQLRCLDLHGAALEAEVVRLLTEGWPLSGC